MNVNPFLAHRPDSAPAGPTLSGPDAAPDTSGKLFADDELFTRRAFNAAPANGYELLFKRYYRPLCSHAVRLVLSKEMAENIVAELFSAFRETARYRTYGIPAGVPTVLTGKPER